MKYQITQSRLDELVMNYLDSVFSDMEENYDAIGGGIYRWWGRGNNGLIDTSTSSDGLVGVGISESIYDALVGMFNLNIPQTDEYFMKWVKENLGIVADEIYVF